MTLAVKKSKKYGYKDYLSWPDEEKWELIGGDAYNMTPAPGIKHQNVAGMFYRIIGNQLLGKPCQPFIAPTDVVFSEYDVVQPDVFVVCDEKKITDANIQGVPDLIVEVLSPATSLKDKREKKFLYEKYGVKEYNIIDPLELYVEQYVIRNSKYVEPVLLGTQEILEIKSIAGIEIPLWEVFGVEKESE